MCPEDAQGAEGRPREQCVQRPPRQSVPVCLPVALSRAHGTPLTAMNGSWGHVS